MLLGLCVCSSCYCGYQSVNIRNVIGWPRLRPKGTRFAQQHLDGSLIKTLHIVGFFLLRFYVFFNLKKTMQKILELLSLRDA